MTVATILSDETFGPDTDEIRLVRYQAPTTEADWISMFEDRIGDPDEARTAYSNMLTAIADDETVGTDVVLWDADDYPEDE